MPWSVTLGVEKGSSEPKHHAPLENYKAESELCGKANSSDSLIQGVTLRTRLDSAAISL